MRILKFILIGCFFVSFNQQVQATPKVERWGGIIKREGQFLLGLKSPTPMFLAQIEQESSGNEKNTASDGGMGLAQMMPKTADNLSQIFPELGVPSPYNPTWAIRALIRYDTYLTGHVQGDDDCQRRAAALKSYNAGLGYVLQAQKVSAHSGTWFGVTELVKTRQSPANFEASRMYPRWIIFKRQPHYAAWGNYTCSGIQP